MAQNFSDTIYYPVGQRLLNKQGLGSRSASLRNRFIRQWAVWLILATVLLLFYVWSRVRVIQLGYESTDLGRKAAALAKEAQTLEMEIAKLESPKRLENIATQKLDLGPPSSGQIVLVKPQD